jgi:hypothetical protein
MSSSCKKETSKKYLTRKSPPYHAKDCKDIVKLGNDGQSYISESDKRGVYKWNKYNKNKTKKVNNKTKKVNNAINTYKIMDNASTPYIAMVKPASRIEVYTTNNEHSNPIKKIVDVKYTKLFVGDNLLKDTSYAKKGKGAGNSLLIQTEKNKYIYVGSEIYSFETKEDIKTYYSPIGNSFVPYPYAVGENFSYFMLDKKIVPNELLDLKKDGYGQFYGYTIDENQSKKIEKTSKKIRVKMIHKHTL